MEPVRTTVRLAAVAAALLLCATTAAEARFGGGRSFGSRGSRPSSPTRSYAPSSPASSPSSPAPAPAPSAPPPAAPAGGGFLRSMAGGIAGGLLGGMLFGSLFGGGAGMAGCGGSGIGLFEILLAGGLAWLAFRFLPGRRRGASPGERGAPAPDGGAVPASPFEAPEQGAPGAVDLETGFRHIRSMDPSFEGDRFAEGAATEIFFKVQGAFAGRDVSAVASLLSPEVAAEFAAETDSLRSARRYNRLENIAMRRTEVVEAWQEAGRDYVTVRFLANLLDYTTDEEGTLLSGSRTEPVLFEEFWTFTRPCGPNGWTLCAVSQP